MDLQLSAEAVMFANIVDDAIGRAGGDALVQDAERDPSIRGSVIGPLLEGLGVWALDPRVDHLELEVAAATCRAAGRVALPYPVAERLARSADSDGLVVVDAHAPMANIAAVDVRWRAIDIAGNRRAATPRGVRITGKLGAFVDHLDLGSDVTQAADEVALALVLPCWTVLGMLDRAFELTTAHVTDRKQFGQPLIRFQAVEFQLADALVALQGLEELAKYSLWTTLAHPEQSLVDALALRLATLEAANEVFRVSHQLHGALGFCDESTLSWLSRYSQAYRRYPHGVAETERLFSRLVVDRGFVGLYG
jgi:hypothetical protein